MNCASARCRRAAGPRRKVKREPDSLAPVSKSRPSGAPRSTWSLTAKSKRARRAPAAHLDVGVLVGADRHAVVRQVGHGHQQRRQISAWMCVAAARPRRPARRPGRPPAAITAAAVLALGLELADLLGQAVALRLQLFGARLDALALGLERDEVLARRGRAAASCAFRSRAITPSRSRRSRLMSSMVMFLVVAVVSARMACGRARRRQLGHRLRRPAPWAAGSAPSPPRRRSLRTRHRAQRAQARDHLLHQDVGRRGAGRQADALRLPSNHSGLQVVGASSTM